MIFSKSYCKDDLDILNAHRFNFDSYVQKSIII